jgi:hypothetical protein
MNMKKYNMKFLVDGQWIKRNVCTNEINRAKTIGDAMIKRQFKVKHVPVIQIVNSYTTLTLRDES